MLSLSFEAEVYSAPADVRFSTFEKLAGMLQLLARLRTDTCLLQKKTVSKIIHSLFLRSILHTAEFSVMIIRGQFPGIFCNPYLFPRRSTLTVTCMYRNGATVQPFSLSSWFRFSSGINFQIGLEIQVWPDCVSYVLERFHIVRCPRHSR